MSLRTKAMRKLRNVYQEEEVKVKKPTISNKRGIEDRSIIIDSNGAIILNPIKTAQEIPAGEYYPTFNRQDNGVLIPISRKTIAKGNSCIIKNNGEITSIDDRNLDEEELLTLLDSEIFDNEFNINKNDLKNQFIPVNSYFPVENYNKGLNSAQENISRFLHSKAIYKELNMDYRRGVLLYGDPGTGKSQFIYQLSKELITNWEAVVIRIEGQRALDSFYDHVMHPISQFSERLKVIVIEELADLCSSRSNSSKLLSLLDSMVLRENVLFLITTNFPEQIPSNIVDRPARLDLLCPIYCKDFDQHFTDSWLEFCTGRKITEKEKSEEWYSEAFGKLSPAYYKELFIYSQLHNIPALIKRPRRI